MRELRKREEKYKWHYLSEGDYPKERHSTPRIMFVSKGKTYFGNYYTEKDKWCSDCTEEYHIRNVEKWRYIEPLVRKRW